MIVNSCEEALELPNVKLFVIAVPKLVDVVESLIAPLILNLLPLLKLISPLTSNLYEGKELPIPTLPLPHKDITFTRVSS